MKFKLISLFVCSLLVSACDSSSNSTSASSTNNASNQVSELKIDSLSGNVARSTATASESQLTELAAANSEFALDLFKQQNKNLKQNTVFSPYSISMAFAMAYGGAVNETAQEIADVLHFDLPVSDFHQAMNSLEQKLSQGADSDEFKLNIVNSQWGDKSYDFAADYANLLSEFYGADIKLSDFVNQPDGVRKQINQWVEQQTEQNITELLLEGSVTSDTRLALVNAVYLSAKWLNEFHPSNTAQRPFTLLDGSKVDVALMRQRLFSLNYYNSGAETLIELPYKNEAWSMYFLHTETDKFASLLDSLSTTRLAELEAGLKTTDVELRLPKFSFAGQLALKDLSLIHI